MTGAARLLRALQAERRASGDVSALLSRVEHFAAVPRPRRVLVVEDDATTRRFLRTALDAAGVDVVAVGTCTEAQESLDVGDFGLVLADMRLPDGDGLTLARTLPREVRVLLMSATVDPALLGHVAERLAGVDVIEKDFADEGRAAAFVARVLAELDR